jgi:DNA-binding NarL/FixJ family response regulator
VLVVDDHPLLRVGIKTQLTAEPGFEIRGEAGSLAEARQLIGELKPDLLVLDAHLPDGDALELLDELKSRADRPKVFVLYEQDGITEQALRLGAGAVVSKRTSTPDLLRIARQVAAGQVVLNDDLIHRLVRRRPRGEE